MFAMKTALLSGAAAIALSSGAIAQDATTDMDATAGSSTSTNAPLLTDSTSATASGDAAVAPGDDAEIVTDTEADTDAGSNVDVAAPGADGQTDLNADTGAETDMAAEGDMSPDAEADADVGGTINTASGSFDFEQSYSGAAGMQIAELIGTDVIDVEGKTVGEIDRFARLNNGIVAVVGVGGFLGLGEDDVALSLDQMNYAAEEGQFKLSGYTEEDVEGMPEYDAAAATELEAETTLEESWNEL